MTVFPESFSLTESIAVLAMVVFGGIGHFPGVILGSFILSALPELLRHVVEPLQQALFGTVLIPSEVLRQLLLSLTMLLMMLHRPAGLWPATQLKNKTDQVISPPQTAATIPLTNARGVAPARTMLNIISINKSFGGLQALSNINLTIQSGQIYGLIGPNGAGKTTLFNVITGLIASDTGSFELAGKPYFPKAPHNVCASGIARTFQNIRLFGKMTTLENVMMGRHVRTRQGILGALFRHPAALREEAAIRARAMELLDFVGIARFSGRMAGQLAYGDQRRLEIARALATEPLLLALDEPAAGMNATEKLGLYEVLLKIKAQGTTILLIEHDVNLVMKLCDRITVLDYGTLIAEGTPSEIQKNPAVIAAYLGEENSISE